MEKLTEFCSELVNIVRKYKAKSNLINYQFCSDGECQNDTLGYLVFNNKSTVTTVSLFYYRRQYHGIWGSQDGQGRRLQALGVQT